MTKQEQLEHHKAEVARIEAEIEKLKSKEELAQKMFELKYAGTCKNMCDIYEQATTLLGLTFDAYKGTSILSSKDIERVCNALNNYTKIKKEVFKNEN